ncbi:Bromodomain-Containing Protein 7 [Manis pentadactyla]|nr:Bromodomain-Containing Protein 7 [Manis pentadactyla]
MAKSKSLGSPSVSLAEASHVYLEELIWTCPSRRYKKVFGQDQSEGAYCCHFILMILQMSVDDTDIVWSLYGYARWISPTNGPGWSSPARVRLENSWLLLRNKSRQHLEGMAMLKVTFSLLLSSQCKLQEGNEKYQILLLNLYLGMELKFSPPYQKKNKKKKTQRAEVLDCPEKEQMEARKRHPPRLFGYVPSSPFHTPFRG